jgi:hypothetical protein
MLHAVASLVFALCGVVARSDEPKKPTLPASQPTGGVAAAKMRFVKATDSAKAGSEIVAILKAARGNFSPLLGDDNASIALFAAWDAAKHKSGQADGADWNWFVGFLQGRTGLSPTLRWEVSLMACHYVRFKQWNPNKMAPKNVLEDYLKQGDVLERENGIIQFKRRKMLAKQAGFGCPRASRPR